MTVLVNSNIPYPDFANLQVIDPEKFDGNNAELQNRFNAVVSYLNTMQSAGLPASAIELKTLTEAQIKDFILNDTIATEYANTADVNVIFSYLVKRIKEITGEATWSTAADDTIIGLATKVADLYTITTSLNNLKAPINNPTFTGVVSGVTKAMVGLTSVDDTSDINKPISTAVQAALNAKETIANLTVHKVSSDHDVRYLAKDNMIGFIPTNGAHPATKAYVDGTLAGAVLGAVPDDSITNTKLSPSTKVGDIAMLNTTSKVSVVDAINEVNQKPTTPGDGTITDAKLATDVKVGSLSALTTIVKSSLQAAINELVTSIGTKLATSAYTAADVFTKVKSISVPTLTDHSNAIGLAWMIPWKNYGSGHVIFDASAGTSPNGSAVNNTNAVSAWQSSYPSLMGWNGSGTYGLRVDSARVADKASNITVSASAPSGGVDGDIWITY